MGLSNYLPTSAIAKPGVIANAAARPASPYDGQVIYQQDTDQAYVWNGSAWVLLSTGTANPPGLELVKTQTIGSAVSSVTVSDAFNSTYTNYRVTIDGSDGSVADTNIYLKFENSLSTYNWSQRYWSYGGAGGDGNQANTSTGILVGISSTDNDTSLSFDVFSPNVAQFTHATFVCSASNYFNTGGGVMKTATAYTSLIISCQAGLTLTGGTIRVYGYKN